jgi:D-aminoacyl-tRNA deacylase
MRCIVASEKDIAGINIWNYLSKGAKKVGVFEGSPMLEKGDGILVKTKKDIIFADNLSEVSADLYIFASRHSSQTKKPCLSAHSTGNFDKEAKYGGEPKELGVSAPDLVSSAIREMEKICPQGFEVSLEVTHHGPTSLEKPAVFIEVGSSEDEWSNLEACKAVADTIQKLGRKEGKAAIGFGGGHYAPAFKPMIMQGWDMGHICPKYRLDELDIGLFAQMVERSSPKPTMAFIDKKGMNSAQMKKVKALAVEYGINYTVI